MRNFLLTIAMLLSVASPASAKLSVEISLVVDDDQDGIFEKSLRDGMGRGSIRRNATQSPTASAQPNCS